MGVIDELYVPSRRDTERQELESWAEMILSSAEDPESDISLTMTPQGPAQDQAPAGERDTSGQTTPPGTAPKPTPPAPRPPKGQPPMGIAAIRASTLGTPQPTERPQGLTAKTGGVLEEIGKAVGGGVMDALQKTVRGVEDASLMAGQQWMRWLGEEAPGPEDIPPEQRASSLIPTADKSESTPGIIARRLVMVATEVAAFGSMLGGSGGLVSLRPIVLDALVDFFGQDPDEGRQADLVLALAPELADTPILGAVTTFLKSDPGDSNAMARFKNMVEGQIFGRLVDVAMHPKQAAQLVTDAWDVLRQAKRSPLTQDLLARLKSEAGSVQLPGGTPARTPAETLEAAQESPGKFNPARQAGPQSLTELTAQVNVRARDTGIMAQQTRGSQSFRETAEKAEALIKSGKMSLDRILGFEIGTVLNAEEGLAARHIRDALLDTADDLMRASDAGDTQAKELLEPMLKLASRVEANIEAASGTEIARSLSARRYPSSRAVGAMTFEELMQRTIDPDLLIGFWKQLATDVEKQAFAKYFEETTRTGRWVHALLEARSAGFLSVRSILRNLIGNTATTAWAVPERMAGATVSSLRPLFGLPREVYFHEALDLLHGYATAQKDTLRLAARALKTGESAFLSADKAERYALPAISGDALGLTGIAGRTADVAGEIIRAPFRGLAAGDDVFKWTNYQGERYALAYRDYRQRLAGGATPEQARAAYTQALTNPPEWLHEAAEELSLYRTFNDEILNPAGKKLMELREHDGPAGWIAKGLVPYARTPMNLFGYGSERTLGLNLLSTHFWQEISEGGARRDMALGQLALGSATLATLTLYALNGSLTGAGPRDPNLRKQYEANGWRPYSFVLPGGVHLPFRGFEPLSQHLAQAADMAELITRGGGWQDVSTLATAMVLSSAEYMSEQPMLAIMDDIGELLENPDIAGPRFIQRQVASNFPLPGFQATGQMIIEQIDPYLRERYTPHGGSTPLGKEVYKLIEEIYQRTPFLSDDLYPMRDALFGQPLVRQGGWWSLSPSAPSAQQLNPVLTELNAQEITIAPPRKSLGSGRLARSPVDPSGLEHEPVELSAREWDRLQELAGHLIELDTEYSEKLLTLPEALAALINTANYRDKSNGPHGGKADAIRSVVRMYREAAEEQLIAEFPRLQEQIALKQRIKEFQKLDQPEQAEQRPMLERQLGRSLAR